MVGLIGRKVGMTQVFDDAGELTPVTVIRIEPNVVVGTRTLERDGYSAVIVGSEELKAHRSTKPYTGQFKDGVTPKKRLAEIRDCEVECAVGDSLSVDVFADYSYVDVIGTSKGKGYQGVIKRHGFHGGRKTHGSKFHRENGSTGQSAFPSNVFKGTKMPGRMGGERRTSQNLRLIKVDSENQLLLVGGAVPGANDGFVLVRDAKKKS